ncbi:hypothetical protein C3L50_06985 [Flavobacterium alvei]|uniref:Uncharacterized protein n=1 Tax=Flavobacterium alvei TaxID=2080416 RepID=A0A2S5ACS8_9FLAO|nr:hypothetical protein [Flavobacterium alvei]POY40381.1 hypothetical protein C3L50_06985 [Flavobacterium alvei]HQE34051.1 hypothetical protein [Flavobacterium alvei]HQF48726.1 hypothetical protein [Flavobacterium alvei]HQK38630.1 hypothetical protein [Flavobacterium alvei]
MQYIKYTPFLYLILAAAFFYDAFTKWNLPNETPKISLLIGGLAVFMFFFRRRFAKKLEDRNKKS